MDTDWCLNCECSFVRPVPNTVHPDAHPPRTQEGIGPYCSPDCQETAGPVRNDHDTDVIYHSIAPVHSRWSGTGPAAIRAWAADIESSSSSIAHLSPPPSPRPPKPRSHRPSTSRLPALMHRKQRPAPPALSISTVRPALPSPSRPIRTPPQLRPAEFLNQSQESIGKASLASGATESTLATPASSSLSVPVTPHHQKSSVFAALASHVCSWVSPTPAALASASGHVKKTTESQKTKFTVVARTRHSPALDIYASESDDDDDDQASVWHLSRTFVLDPPPMRKKLLPEPLPRPRGRKIFRS
jgi:hypothetical protein